MKLKGYCLPQWYLHLVKEHFSTLTVTVSSASAQLRPPTPPPKYRLYQGWPPCGLHKLSVKIAFRYHAYKADCEQCLETFSQERRLNWNYTFCIFSLMHGFCLSCFLKCISHSSWSLPPLYYTIFAYILILSLCVLSTLQGQFQQQVVRHAHIYPLIIKVENDTLKTSFLSSFPHDMHVIMHFKAMVK